MPKLEVGKTYITRDGKVRVKIIWFSVDKNYICYFYGDNNQTYRANGQKFEHSICTKDLVALADEEKPARYAIIDCCYYPNGLSKEEAEEKAREYALANQDKEYSVVQIVKTYKAKIEVEEV